MAAVMENAPAKAKTNGKAKKPLLPPEIKSAKLEVSYKGKDGLPYTATVGLPMAIAKNILTNTNAKKALRKSVRGGATDTVVVKLSAV